MLKSTALIHRNLSIPKSKLTIILNQQLVIKRNKQTNKPQDPNVVAQMDEYQFVNADDLAKKRPKSIYCWGYSSTGALGRENYLSYYNKGWNNKGKQGIPPMIRKTMIKSPQRLRFINPKRCHVNDVAAGSGFTVIACTYSGTEHTLFGCGLNTDSQIGNQINFQTNKSLSCIAEPVPIDLPIATNNEKVIKVACGRAHTVCLTNHSNVYTLGNNSFGQCGRRICDREKYFAQTRVHCIDYDDKNTDPFIDIYCGLDHTMLLTKAGIVYTFGWASDGQLGNGSYRQQWKLSRVIGDVENEKIVKLSSAGDTVLALNDKGQIFGWGNNEYGQLFDVRMNDDTVFQQQINVSKYLNVDKMIGKIVDIAASGSMCAVLNESGLVFVWGFGILGLGPNVRESPIPRELDPNLFGRNLLNYDTKIVKIFAGLQHFGAINNRGELFMWGKNNRANLGIGTTNDMMFPYRLSMPVHVTKLSFGHDHTIAIGHGLI